MDVLVSNNFKDSNEIMIKSEQEKVMLNLIDSQSEIDYRKTKPKKERKKTSREECAKFVLHSFDLEFLIEDKGIEFCELLLRGDSTKYNHLEKIVKELHDLYTIRRLRNEIIKVKDLMEYLGIADDTFKSNS